MITTFKRILHRKSSYYCLKLRSKSLTWPWRSAICSDVVYRLLGEMPLRLRVTVSTTRQRGKVWHHVKFKFTNSVLRIGKVDGNSEYLLEPVRETFSRLGVTSLWFKLEAL